MKDMNKTNRQRALALLILAAICCSTGCGEGQTSGNTFDNSAYTGEKSEVEIWYWESGYGKEFLVDICKAFTEKCPQYTLVLKPTSDASFIENKLPSGAEINTADVMMSADVGCISKYCVALDDIVEAVNDGEHKSIGEKIGEEVLDTIKFEDGHYYYTPYAFNWCGLVYDVDVMQDYYIPTTTDQLIALANELVDDSKTPFIHFADGGYWSYLYDLWAAQYYGVENYKDLYTNPTLEKLTSETNGIYESLKVVEQLVSDRKMCYNGSNSFTFTDAQTMYWEGAAVMMVNGSWLEYEMSQNYAAGTKNYAMMKSPVISSIIEQCSTIQDDDELACLIEAIDVNKTELSGTGYSVNQADYDKVKNARNLMSNNGFQHAACIPAYSENIEGAKAFLRFYYSDEALKIFSETTHCSAVAEFDADITIDQSSWSSWSKSQYALRNTCEPFMYQPNSRSKIYIDGQCSLSANLSVVTLMANLNPADKLTASQVWEQIKGHHVANWDNYYSDAGLAKP